MLAVDVRQGLRQGRTVAEAASRAWRYSEQTIMQHGDFLLAFVDGSVCVGAFEVLGNTPGTDGKYVLDLAPTPRFQWALGRLFAATRPQSRTDSHRPASAGLPRRRPALRPPHRPGLSRRDPAPRWPAAHPTPSNPC